MRITGCPRLGLTVTCRMLRFSKQAFYQQRAPSFVHGVPCPVCLARVAAAVFVTFLFLAWQS
jgi:predicted transporter